MQQHKMSCFIALDAGELSMRYPAVRFWY